MIKIAIAQLRCELKKKEANLNRILQTIKEAEEKKADYVLFPELYLSGYALDEDLYSLAETENGESIRRIQLQAKKSKVGAIVGFPELDKNCLYNSALLIGKDGKIIGKYRKVHLYHQEKQWFTAGNSFPVFSLPEGDIGLMITYDMEFPEASRILALKNAQLLLVLAANMLPYQHYQDVFLRARALENHIYIGAANMVGLDNENIFFGESQVVHPNGKTIYKGRNNEELPVLSIDLNEINHEKGLLDYLQNRRPDVYHSEQSETNKA
ncbi:carbon-nitrogen hydrolase family protein [Pseudobacillus wudalianchiensis]|uniref:Carbon-nitrogen hydrolase n=1 Tax=Pseudobacillus wudalianchiensis TaxID=1743143 RepID=A0A1B9AYH7_9BACI|nr:carbon-nitrogen hydrolase family protein [Bacillus wudalianchiensis]OCA88768.1 carbon-nitrogen hydrolase [Bacillus wudalianchiensis]